jgi:DNA sulfur modification protein DndD
MHSLTDRRNLSRAYSEILGIKKYEELKQNLSEIRIRYRKESANSADAEKLERLEVELIQLEKLKQESAEKIADFINEKNELRLKSDKLQEKLIREGSTTSLDQIKKMQSEKNKLAKEYEVLKTRFAELIELAPFAIAGNLLLEVEEQVSRENEERIDKQSQRLIERRLKKILEELSAARPADFIADRKTKNFYIKTLTGLFQDHFSESDSKEPEKMLLRLKNEELTQFMAVLQNLRSSYRLQLADINRLIVANRFEFNKRTKRLSEAEAKETDELIQNFRNEKSSVEEKIIHIEHKLVEEHKKNGAYDHQYNSKKKIYGELSKKVQLHDRYKDKDELAERVINNLDAFLMRIKNEKRISLESRILDGLRALMHKQHFITKVKVNISLDIIDISLFNAKGEVMKENLSKGEQQLYATALLKALVEESNIRFPVFVDSPMQKYDAIHSSKVITEFYPTISDQVVVFPLLHKEMTQAEYNLLLPYVKSVHLIENNGGPGSSFRECKPEELFKESLIEVTHVKQHQNVLTE